MKLLFTVGLIILILGIVSFFIPIQRRETEGVKAGDVTIGIEVRRDRHLSPVISTVLVVVGAGMMIAGTRRKTS